MPDLKQILIVAAQRILRFWTFLLLTMTVMAVIAALYLNARVPKYDVSMVVAPATAPGVASGKSLLGLGSAASLLGGAGLGGGDANLQKLQELLTSPDLPTRLGTNSAVFRTFYASEWNPVLDRWQPPQGLFAEFRRSISEALGRKPWGPPTPARFAEDMQNSLIFAPVGKSDMLRITMRTENPEFAVVLLNTLHGTADSLVREAAKRRATAYLAYLNREIPNVTTSENRTAIADLILDQERQLMSLSAGDISFASEIVERPHAGYRPIGLSPLAVLALAILFGALIGTFVVYNLPSNTASPYRPRSWRAMLQGWLRSSPKREAQEDSAA